MPEATVHIVDDDPVLREALVSLCLSDGLAAVGHGDPGGLAQSLRRRSPECVLLDVRLAEQSGLAVQDSLRADGNTVPIIFLTGYGTIPMSVRAMRGGAVEFLTKPFIAEVLLAAIRKALAADAVALADRRARDDLSARLSTLTPRERDVMRCAIGGLMNKQIAAELGITEITAKVHKRRVMEKMQARSLADLVRMADQLGVAATRQR
ncbi:MULTISPECIES: response regulator transcription factor [unclassified Methylobacterium]|uniref:response regulator transcription factor n=1 Tax=unclassified Methylobacterium TaxID=2615210 RepID=UPI00037752EC|nr:MULTISPECIES: response regulator [unclassified Methylobacterium]KQO53181.1 two-component system response regulator [Methylobacterium sp. Leaf85]KQP51598.1 two-component system response regulator [Methylobacterium sp. Leaf106]